MSTQTAELRQRLDNATGQLAGVEAGVSAFGQGPLSNTLRQIVAELRSVSAEVDNLRQQVRRDTASEIALAIRADLVCCDVYDRHAGTKQAGTEHAICFWSEASARFADDVANEVPA